MNTHSLLGRYPLYFQLTLAVFVLLTFLWSVFQVLLWPGLPALS